MTEPTDQILGKLARSNQFDLEEGATKCLD